MSDPTGRPEEERAREALRDQAHAASQLDPAWVEQYQDEARLAAHEEQQPILRERLFSRKVLFGWAFAALVFVFIIRMVVPVVFETVRETIMEKMHEPTSNTAAPAIAPVTPVPPVPAIPAVPAIPGASAAPAPPAVPAPTKK